MSEKRHYVYRMSRTNGQYYIGIRSCVGAPEDDTKYRGSGKRVRSSVRKHPTEWSKSILCELPTRAGCSSLEAALVPVWRMDNDSLCLNLREGGDHKAGLSMVARRNLTGRIRSPEYCAKIAAARRGTRASDVTRARMSAAKVGKKRGPYSAEHRANIGAGHRGKVLSPETRMKIRIGYWWYQAKKKIGRLLQESQLQIVRAA